MSGAGGKSGSVTVGYRYSMDIHMGLCLAVDEIVEIRAGDVPIYPLNGQPTITTDETVPVNAYEAFGGDKKEGGILGFLTVMMGGAAQVVNGAIKARMGGRVPDFRGAVTLYFSGIICALNPYPKAWSFRVRRTNAGWQDDVVWQPSLAAIWLAGGTIKAMNAAHIIYEAATNKAWGRGMDTAIVDEGSLLDCANTLIDEELGLCLRWNKQDELQTFVQQVVDHVSAAVFISRETGLLTMKLIRGDYDPEDLPLFDYNSGLLEIEESDTAAPDTAVNEVVVKFRDPILKEERSTRVQNLASLQSLGGAVNNRTVTYAGLPTLDLAARVAQRDLRVLSTALKKYSVRLDRRAWKINPGDVFRVSAPDKGIQTAILRVGKVTHGALVDGAIQVEAMIDVFGLPASAFIAEEPAGWTPPDRTAQVITTRLLREATYRDLYRATRPADLALIDDTAAFLYTAAKKPSALTLSYDILSHVTGELYARRAGSGFVPTAVMTTALGLFDDEFDFDSGTSLLLVEVGDALQIGGEILSVLDIDRGLDGVSGTLTVARGCVDTLPQAHSIGAKIFFTDEQYGSDRREYTAGETVSVKMLSVTSSQVLDPSLAAEDTIDTVARQGRPYPPGNLKVNDARYGTAPAVVGDVVLTWAHRDRLLQQDQLVGHEEASIGPEAGTTYVVRAYVDPGDLVPVRTVTGIAGATWTYTDAMAIVDGIAGNVTFELESIRDGLTSFSKYRFSVAHSTYGAALDYSDGRNLIIY